jgi:protein TonB
MFEQTFVQSQSRGRNQWTVAVSLSLQCLGIAILLLIPLLHNEALRIPDPPQPRLIRTWIDQPPVPKHAANTHAAGVVAPAPERPVFLYPTIHKNTARQIEMPTGSPEPATWSGPAGAALSSPLGEVASLPERAVAQTQATPKPVVAGPLRVGGGVEAAKLLFGPKPVYPQLAKMARSQGVVKLEAVIAADGSIRNLRAVSGPPLLVNAAIDAVTQWRYQPTLLNGVAVEVVTEIEVNFSLTQ